MTAFFLTTIAATLLAFYAEQRSVVTARTGTGSLRRHRRRTINPHAFWSVLSLLVLFVGLRDSYNDTLGYRRNFNNLYVGLNGLENINWALAENPGFHISNILIKTIISKNSQVMFLIYAMISLGLVTFFYQRWSIKLWLTIYLFSSSGLLLFSMAAQKQVLAMAIGVYGITCFLQNKKKWFVAIILLGGTIHPYLLFYLGAFVLSDRLWSKKVTMIVGVVALAGFFTEQFVQLASSTTQVMGAELEKHGELSGKGVNILRFLVYSVTPALTWIHRTRINEAGSKSLILFSNLTLIGWCFMFIALFSNANTFGRMAMYFDPFMHVALTTILCKLTLRDHRHVMLTCCLLGYFFYLSFELYNSAFEYAWSIN